MQIGSRRAAYFRYALLAPAFGLALGIAYNVSTTKVAPEDIHRPSRIPDRVVLTWTGDPATTQAVTWRTDTSVRTPKAQIAVSEDGPGFVQNTREVPTVTTALKTDLGEASHHTALFTGLNPRTMYAYRVGDGESWSEWNQFTTAAGRSEPLTFLYVGDAQVDILSQWSRVIRMAYARAPEAQFILHAGDLINRFSNDQQWGEWFKAAGWINSTVPSFPSPGNHEYGTLGPEGGRGLTRHWRPQFALPENGPPGLEETCYYLDIQGVRMISLNSNEKKQEQAEWLDKLLARNPNKWTIVTFHHPIYSTARNRDNKELRALWQPVFDRHAVDLVLQGHDHTYGRSGIVSGEGSRTLASGTVYIVSVSGPKMYRLQRGAWMRRAAEDTQLFQIVRVEGDVLKYEARTARGLLYDAFELRKRPKQRNQLIDRLPGTPERTREVSGSEAG